MSVQTEFTVDARKAGLGAALDITAVDPESNVTDVKVTDNGNGTFTCRYTATKSVLLTIYISYGGVAVPKSPFKVCKPISSFFLIPLTLCVGCWQ